MNQVQHSSLMRQILVVEQLEMDFGHTTVAIKITLRLEREHKQRATSAIVRRVRAFVLVVQNSM